MKQDIHPDYFKDAVITCACGTKRTIGSTEEKISIEICAACHPFFTGKQKVVDTAGRVERFQVMRSKQEEAAELRKGKKAKEAARAVKKAASEQ